LGTVDLLYLAQRVLSFLGHGDLILLSLQILARRFVTLTVVATEGYEQFAANLQKED
jgi:hypothetical protein